MQPNKLIPVILDTDIGNDIDDTWALGMLLNSPEFDLKMILVSTGDVEYRAKVTAKFLEKCGRTDIPIGLGCGGNDGTPESMHEYADSYSLHDYRGKIWQDGVAQALRLIEEEPSMTVIGISPLSSLGELCRQAGNRVSGCRLVVMAGSIEKQLEDQPGAIAEYNIMINREGARQTFAAPWKEIRLTPLDHCGNILLRGDNFRQILNSTEKIPQAILEQYRVWRKFCALEGEMVESSILFDTAAVHLAHSMEFTEAKKLRIIVDEEGFTRISPDGREMTVALELDKPSFAAMLVKRITGTL